MNADYGSRDVWEAYGADYDKAFWPSFTAIAEAALRYGDLVPGMRVLDIAAGSGALSIPAAIRGADVLATDLSPSMLELLRARAEAGGITSIRTAVMDGTALDLEDRGFDRVCSQFGVMLFPDPDAGLREMYRVTAKGGRGLMVIFGRPERVAPVWLFGQALQMALPEIDVPQGTRLQTDPLGLPDAMEEAGFTTVRLETLQMTVHVGSPSGVWDMMSTSAPGLAKFLGELEPEKVDAVRSAVIDAVTAVHGADVTDLPVEVLVGVGYRS